MQDPRSGDSFASVQAALLGMLLIPASFGSPLIAVALTANRLSMEHDDGPPLDWNFVGACWGISLAVLVVLVRHAPYPRPYPDRPAVRARR